MAGEFAAQLRAFRLFLSHRFFTMLAGEMVQAAIPLLIYQQTSSVSWSGLAYATTWLPRVLLQPVMGALVDAMSARAPFLLSDFARAGIVLVLIYLNSPFFLLVGGAFVGLLSGMAFIAVERAVTHTLGLERTPDVQSKLQFVEQSAIILGPLTAATLVSAYAGNYVFLFACVIFALALPITNWGFSNSETHGSLPKIGHVFPRMMAGAREILAKPDLLGLAGTTAAINFVEGTCVASLPARIVGSLHHSESSIGIILSIAAGQNLLLLLLISRFFRTSDTRIMYRAALILIPLGALLFGTAGSVALTGLGYVVMILGRVLFVVHMRIVRAKLIEQERFSATMGAFLSIVLFPLPLAGLTLSVLGPLLEVETFIGGVAVLFTGLTVIAFLRGKDAR